MKTIMKSNHSNSSLFLQHAWTKENILIKTRMVMVFVLLIIATVASSCSSQNSSSITTPVPSLSLTPIPSVTSTVTPSPTAMPTSTITPTATPVPLGGGGKFIMKVNPLLAPKEFKSQKPASWFSAYSDGSNLTLLDWQIWSLSPNGRLALTYTSNNNVALTNLDNLGTTLLDESLSYYIISGNYQTALWLPNGNIVLLAFEQKERTKISAYIVSPDGKLTKLEKPSQIMKNYAHFLFISPDGKKLYWENPVMCGNRQCKSEYYETSLDDAEQKRILKDVNTAQDINISPSGQYIAYIDNSFQTLRGCYIYKVSDETITKIMKDDGLRGQNYCFGGNHWSPTEDKLFGQTPDGYAILTVPEGNISTFPEVNVGSCYLARWAPDGKHLFLSVCTEKNSFKEYGMNGGVRLDYQKFVQTIGERLINISDGKVTEYSDVGFCDAVISPDSTWVLFYACKDEKKRVIYPSQLLNLNTKKMYPLFQGFVSDSTEVFTGSQNGLYKGWLVFWII
jgi:hypothetical protein